MDEKIKENETQEEGYKRIEQQTVKLGNLVYKVQMHLNEEKKARNRNNCLQGFICCTKSRTYYLVINFTYILEKLMIRGSYYDEFIDINIESYFPSLCLVVDYQPDKYQERQSSSNDNETCYIKWKIETTDKTKMEKVVPELEMAADYMEAPFRIEFVHIGSLILGTTVKSHLENADDSPGSPSDEYEKDPSFVEVSECSSNEPLPISNNDVRCESQNIQELNLVENSENSSNAPLPTSNNAVRCYSRNIHELNLDRAPEYSSNAPLPISNNAVRCYSRNIYELNLDRAPEYSSNTPQPVSNNAVRCYSRNIHELNLDRAPEYSSNAPLPVSNNAVRCYSRNIHELNLDRAPEYSSNTPQPVSNNAVRCYSRNIHELNLEYSECPEQLVYVYN
ncbi:unnamed protein product [Mytilus coruscus]|uniref:Uncharacterized protein n=1 Tax=Mytilus coruscus TaxID=42192 RepID=A0A6J8BZ15_MYTCO|nr:unnamed protein product [Mytilus coruscus]